VTSRTLLAAAAGLALVASLAGCAPTAAPADDPLPKTPTEACLGVAQETSSMWVTTDDGTFDVGVIGDGEVTAILVHQMNENECGWFPFAANLADEGVRVLLLNLCGYGETTCTGGSLTGTGADAVLATADWARENGAERVVVAGASIGGTTAMVAAAHDAETQLLDGVADLSSPIVADGSDLRRGATSITIPAFLAVGPGDSVVSVSAMHEVADALASAEVTLLDDANGHGWDMLNGPAGPERQTVAEQLTAFILG
jgi:pimeloyl-ACP methyl ester carboxylesterase